MSFQREYCAAIAAAIEQIAEIKAAGNVTCLPEDSVSAADAVKKQLGRLGLLVLVASTGHRRSASSGRSTTGELSIEISIYENPKLNRAISHEAYTLTQCAEDIVSALHWLTVDGFAHCLRYVEMSRADADEQDARMIVQFVAEQSLTEETAVKWGIGERAIWGEALDVRRSRGGEAMFEQGRNGRARFMGIRDAHDKVLLTVAVESRSPPIPQIGERFAFAGREFVTTTAEEIATVESGTRIALSGRTVD